MKHLLEETLHHYDEVLSVYKSSGYGESYKLNAFWSDANMKSMLKILRESKTSSEAIHAVQQTFLFSVNTSESVKEKAVDWILADQKNRGIDIFDLDNAFQESSISNPANNVVRKTRILTPDFLRTMNIASEIQKHFEIKESGMRILELGAGCGHLARTLQLFMPRCSYVIIDLPETLSFSYMFLRSNFPDRRMLYVTEPKQLEKCLTGEFDNVFIPTKFAEGILKNKFDLFINTASLGEMNNSVIRYWMDFIQKKLMVKYLFTLNRFLNTIKTDGSMNWRLDENECSVLYDANWKMIHWELEPSFTRCPYVDTIIARYVEIAAEKIQPISTAVKRKESQQLLSEVMQEDWLRLEKSFPPEMTFRDNILVNAMTMDGALFKLWESIRLDANEFNVAAMLKCLETFLHKHDREFEETYFYEKLFDDLFLSKNNRDLLEISESIAQKRKYRKLLSAPPPSLFKSHANLSLPHLLEGYEGFNIVKWGELYWALWQKLGPVDFTDAGVKGLLEKYRQQEKCFSGRSIVEVKYLLAKSKSNANAEISKSLMKDIVSRDENIVNLQKEIQTYRKAIEDLQADIALRDQNFNILKHDTARGEEIIENLERTVQEHRKDIGALQADLMLRDKTIGSLKEGVVRREASIGKLEKEIEAFHQQVNGLRAEIDLRDQSIGALDQELVACSENIRKLNEELAFIRSKWWFRFLIR